MTKLRRHQRILYDFALDKPASLCAGGMGTGKSCVAIKLADAWKAQKILLLCPTTVRPVWRREIPKHSERNVLACILDRGTIKKRTERAEEAFRSRRPVWIVINYEAAWREPFREWCLSRQWDLVVLDESHRCHGMSRTALFCNDLRERSGRRLCLSGTPLTKDPISVWAQCRFLDPNVFTHSLKWFRYCFENQYAVACRKALARFNKSLRYFIPDAEPWTFPEESMEGTINTEWYLEELGKLAVRVESDVLDLPPISFQTRVFHLSSTARGIYEAVKGGHSYELETGLWPDILGSYSITMRLQQITSGWLEDRAGTILPVDRGKARCLEDILRDAGEPVVVFCRFIRDMDICRDICDKLGLRYGEISQRRKDGLDDMGTMPEWCEVVGVQEQAGGAGIDLTRARIGVDYSPSWVLPNYDQKVARLYRPPQDRPVVIYQLIAEDTIDEEIHRALEARRQIIRRVWSGLAAVS